MSANKDGDGGWSSFLWNSEKGEFLGRTGASWCKYTVIFHNFNQCGDVQTKIQHS